MQGGVGGTIFYITFEARAATFEARAVDDDGGSHAKIFEACCFHGYDEIEVEFCRLKAKC